MFRRLHPHWSLAALVFFLLVYSHQTHFDSPTPVSRLDLLHAICFQNSVCIDAYHTNTPDKAVFENHFYSDKAPGTVVAALPAFALSKQILHWTKVPPDSKPGWLFSSWLACAGSIALITALGAAALFSWLLHWATPRASLITVLALFLGAAPLPYSTMMFSHALVIGLICISIWAIRFGVDKLTPAGTETGISENIQECPKQTVWLAESRRDLLAGFCSGWALASEYSCGLIITGIFVWLAWKDYRRAVRFALAMIPPLLLIPLYSYACFGNPFILPYSLQAAFPEMKKGVYAIQWPDPETAFKLLFTPERGLLFWTPFLLMAGFGYWILSKYPLSLLIFTYTIPVMHFIVISGRTWDWPAGPTLGPRLLSPMLPMLALPCALGVQRFTRTGIALAIYSIAITTLATLTDAVCHFHIGNPLLEQHVRLLIAGEFSPNLGMAAGLSPYVSIILFYATLLTGAVLLFWRLKDKSVDRRRVSDNFAGILN